MLQHKQAIQAYCDTPGCGTFIQTVQDTKRKCFKALRRYGWLIKQTGLFCPKCAKNKE